MTTHPCCEHCAEDQPHIPADTHDLPCDMDGCQVVAHNCADAFPTVSVPVGREFRLILQRGAVPLLVIPVHDNIPIDRDTP